MIEAEQAFIRAILIKPSLLDDFGFITEGSFETQRHRNIFSCVVDMVSKSELVDTISVAEKIGHFEYLTDLHTMEIGMMPGTAARIMERDAFKRNALCRLDNARMQIINAKDIDQQVSIMSAVPEGMERASDEFKPFNEMIKSSLDRLDARMKGTSIEGLYTGFKDVDERLGGLMPAQLCIIAGRPAMGKTTYAMNIAENVAIAGGNVLVFSLEMSEQELMDRMLSSLSGIASNSIKRGKLDEGELSNLTGACYKLKRMSMTIIDRPAMHVRHVANIANKFNRTKKLDLIVIDYLQLMRSDAKDRFQEISEISRALKAMAKTLDVPVIALSQMSRGVETRSNRKPVMSDLRESGQIEQDADIIQMLYRDEYYNEKTEVPGMCEVITAKFRNGETGSDWLTSELDRVRFANARYVPQEKPQEIGYQYARKSK